MFNDLEKKVISTILLICGLSIVFSVIMTLIDDWNNLRI